MLLVQKKDSFMRRGLIGIIEINNKLIFLSFFYFNAPEPLHVRENELLMMCEIYSLSQVEEKRLYIKRFPKIHFQQKDTSPLNIICPLVFLNYNSFA